MTATRRLGLLLAALLLTLGAVACSEQPAQPAEVPPHTHTYDPDPCDGPGYTRPAWCRYGPGYHPLPTTGPVRR